MALQNHPSLFTGGNERVDSRPHTMLYAQLMQRKQARDDAYDEYIRNLNKNINPAGLRNVDRPAFEQKLKEWQQYGMQNKDVLRNPRKDSGGASIEFQARYQDLVNLINESKQEEEKKKPLIDVMTNPERRDRLNEEDLFPKIALHDQPLFKQDPKTGQWVRDENRRSFNVADLDFNPKPFEQDKYFKSFDDIKRSDLPPSIVKDRKNMTQTITTQSVFDQDAKDLVATRAVAQLMRDEDFRKNVIGKLDPSEYNDFFKKNYGHDIESEADLAAAYTLKGIQGKTVKSELKDDDFAQGMARTRYTQDRIDARQRRANDFILARDSFRRSQDAKVVDEYVESQYNDPNALPATVTNEGNTYKGRMVKAPKPLRDKYSQPITDGSGKVTGWKDPEFVMTEDRKFVIPVFKTGKKTKSGWEKVSSNPIPMRDWKIEISNDFIKSNRTANELADEFDVEGEVDESGGTTIIQKQSKPVKGILD